jgi:hypothetical protein
MEQSEQQTEQTSSFFASKDARFLAQEVLYSLMFGILEYADLDLQV